MEQTIIGLFEKFGFPALVTGVLLYWVLKVQGEKLDKHGDKLDQQGEKLDKVVGLLERLVYLKEISTEAIPWLRQEQKDKIANGGAPCPPAEKTGKAA